jgi:hypothetical protein
MSFDNSSEKIELTGTPSVSPIYGNSPGYKVYQFSKDSLELKDSYVHNYSLPAKHIFGNT